MVPVASLFVGVLVGCFSVSVSQSVNAGEPPHFRPSRSEPAYQIERGETEFEVGVLAARSRADGRELRSVSAPAELRMGFADGWLIQVGIEGFTHRRETGGERVQGLGSSSIAIRHTRPISDAVWASVLLGTSLATAHSSLGSDRTAPFIQTALTWYGKKLRLTGVTKYSRSEDFDEFETGTPAAAGSLTLASFYDLDERFGLAADFNFDHLRGRGTQRSVIAGFVWRANSRLLFDVGIGTGQGALGTQRLLTAGTIVYF
jgi:hypothetical protein